MPHKDPDARRAYHRKWAAEWRSKNPEKARERSRLDESKRVRDSESRRASQRESYARNREARIAYAKNRRKQHPEIYQAWQRENRAQLSKKTRQYVLKRNHDKIQLVEKLKRRACLDCRRTFPPVCLDFDHRPQSNKAFVISRAVLDCKVTLAALKAEIAKCELVCACCHRLRTAARHKAR